MLFFKHFLIHISLLIRFYFFEFWSFWKNLADLVMVAWNYYEKCGLFGLFRASFKSLTSWQKRQTYEQNLADSGSFLVVFTTWSIIPCQISVKGNRSILKRNGSSGRTLRGWNPKFFWKILISFYNHPIYLIFHNSPYFVAYRPQLMLKEGPLNRDCRDIMMYYMFITW